MRFKQHINEDIPERILTALQRDCKPFISDVKNGINKLNHFLYRGMKSSSTNNKEYGMKTVRQDRQPLDSSERWHTDLGAGFKRKFGVNARSQGVFTSIMASCQYGTPQLIFPVGKYYCIWSNEIDDATEWEPDAIYDYGGDGVQDAVDKHVDKLMKTYHKGDLNQAIRGIEKIPRSEIVVMCKQYYFVSITYESEMEEWIKNEL